MKSPLRSGAAVEIECGSWISTNLRVGRIDLFGLRKAERPALSMPTCLTEGQLSASFNNSQPIRCFRFRRNLFVAARTSKGLQSTRLAAR
jgi:hypothetical protein